MTESQSEQKKHPRDNPIDVVQDLLQDMQSSTGHNLKDALDQAGSPTADRVSWSFIRAVSKVSALKDRGVHSGLVIKTLQEYFEADRIAIIQVDQDTRRHQVIAHSPSFDKDQLALLQTVPFPGSSTPEKAVSILHEGNGDSLPSHDDLMAALSTKAAILLPNQLSAHPMWLIVDQETPQSNNPLHISLGQILFNLIGIQYFLRYEQRRSETYIKKLEMIRQVAIRVNTRQSLDSVFRLILKSVLDILPEANNAHIFLLQQGQLVYQDARWADGKRGRPIKHPRQDGLTACTAQQGEVMVVNDTSAHPLYIDDPYEFKGSLLAVPFVYQHKVLGVMTVAYRTKHAVTQEIIRLLKLFAAQAAVAIENTRMNLLLQEQANTDRLTGLPNRRALEKRFAGELQRASRYRRKFSVLFLDLDNYKTINDQYGHQTGDRVLNAVARQLQQIIRDSDCLFRYGGDEFVVLLPESSRREAILGGQRIQRRLETELATLTNKRGGGPVGISYGAATFPTDGSTMQELLRAADQALYRNK